MPAFMTFDGHSQSFVPEDPNNPFAGYPTSTTIGGGPSSSYAQVAPVTFANFGTATATDMSQFQYQQQQQQYPDAAAWEYADYSYDPNDPNSSLGYDYDASLDMSTLPEDSQHGHQDASGWYGYSAQQGGDSGQGQNWR